MMFGDTVFKKLLHKYKTHLVQSSPFVLIFLIILFRWFLNARLIKTTACRRTDGLPLLYPYWKNHLQQSTLKWEIQFSIRKKDTHSLTRLALKH